MHTCCVVLQMCESRQAALECILSFRWYCGYQASALACITKRKQAFNDLVGRVLLQLEASFVRQSTDMPGHVLRIAGTSPLHSHAVSTEWRFLSYIVQRDMLCLV
jgi:hypothetical protein